MYTDADNSETEVSNDINQTNTIGSIDTNIFT